ncbi:MAG: hypothetical protein EKK56_07970 [Flavobacteriaceae bacterium]|nr:MAG: hypothetical protein EKK56_07970 [Flavobacteriaceae bacterium]
MKLTQDQINLHKAKMQEPIILREQIASLQNLLAGKDNEILALRNELNQKNTYLSQKDSQLNSLSSQNSYSIVEKDKEIERLKVQKDNELLQFKAEKDNEITQLKAQIEIYKNSALNIQKELSQKDFLIEFMSKNIDELKAEKSELKEENKVIKKELIFIKSISKGHINLSEKSVVISEYFEQKDSELVESKVLGDSFSILEEQND